MLKYNSTSYAGKAKEHLSDYWISQNKVTLTVWLLIHLSLTFFVCSQYQAYGGVFNALLSISFTTPWAIALMVSIYLFATRPITVISPCEPSSYLLSYLPLVVLAITLKPIEWTLGYLLIEEHRKNSYKPTPVINTSEIEGRHYATTK
jgi:hypothetical protein